ncbi:helix-turn-helix domain-containing protein [Streptomyces sp. DG2A-72]|uniref:helix-turn-helix domain-containing protein n=1 Tax=Streptomyces sp. DG2A-72 TaxID=3051386 RepID=UPI0034649ADD
MVRMQAAELFEQKIKPPKVARRLRVSPKSAYQWISCGRTVACRRWPPAARVDRDVGCPRAVWRSWPHTLMKDPPRTDGWRTTCGPPPG